MGKVADFFSAQKITLPVQQKQQMLALDQQFEALQSKVTGLEAENLKLRAEVNPLKQEVERLQTKVQQESAHDDGRLDEVSENMLITIANGESRRDRVIPALKLSKAKGDYHFDILCEKILAIVSYGFWETTPQGRAYLAKHGLL